MTVLWYLTLVWSALAIAVALVVSVVLRGAEVGARRIGARAVDPPPAAPLGKEPLLR